MNRIHIHACPTRIWYVTRFLIPQIESQGIKYDIYVDEEGKGNLEACMEVFRTCEDAWHVEDDVYLSKTFKKRTKGLEGIVNGFCCEDFDDVDAIGRVKAEKMWSGFPCIHIPKEVARGCREWLYDKGRHEHPDWYKSGKMCDTFFKAYCEEMGYECLNLKPNLVEHVDWLIGGSVTNKPRKEVWRAKYFEGLDEEFVRQVSYVTPGEKRCQRYLP